MKEGNQENDVYLTYDHKTLEDEFVDITRERSRGLIHDLPRWAE